MSPRAPKSAKQILAESMSEKDLEGECLTRYERYQIMRHHQFRTDPRSEGGWPDEALTGTRFMLRELKAQKGRVKPSQKTTIAALDAAGVDVDIWRPMDLLTGRIDRELQAISPLPGYRDQS